MSTTSSAVSRSSWPAKGFAAVIDYATASNRRAAAVLVLLAALTLYRSVNGFLTGFHRPGDGAYGSGVITPLSFQPPLDRVCATAA